MPAEHDRKKDPNVSPDRKQRKTEPRSAEAGRRLEKPRQPSGERDAPIAGDVDARRLEHSAERMGQESGDAPFDALSDAADDTT